MCGRKSKHGLKNIGALLLVLLCLSLVSLSANSLDELQQILTNYEQSTQNLQNDYVSVRKNYELLRISMPVMESDINILRQNSTEREIRLQSLETQSSLDKETLNHLKPTIVTLEIGYKNMEKQLQIYKGLNKILIGVVSVLTVGVVVLYVLP